MAQVYAAYNGVPAETLSQDAKAMAIGQRLFINNCATCHGSDARGSKGFPNLTDNDWLHGGTAEKIEETITLAGPASCRRWPLPSARRPTSTTSPSTC
jgi:cytochrome c oxidase cbb3-type subunit 3